MPYIDSRDRPPLDKAIQEVLSQFDPMHLNVGKLNYVLSKIVRELFLDNKCYATANSLVGVLECVKQEAYRTAIAAYEDLKKRDNGDI